MSHTRFNLPGILIVMLVAAVGCLRVLFSAHPDFSSLAQYSPVGAMALFGGACFNRPWKALLFPLATLFISDIILQQTVHSGYSTGILYSGWGWVYGAFILMTIFSRIIMKNITPSHFLFSVLTTVMIHWIVTDIGVWYGSADYSQNITGYAKVLALAIPFELRFLAGTLVFGVILFGIVSLLKNRYPAMQRSF